MKIRQWGKPEPEPGMFVFFCPGCKELHHYDPRWTFNGDMERPTFTPSLLHPRPNHKTCHLFLTDGVIQFLPDCEHELAGKSVPLPELPEWAY